MLRHLARSARRALRAFPNEIAAWRHFWRDYEAYNALVPADGDRARLDHLYPCIHDATAQTEIEPIYFYQDTWAFGKIVQKHPMSHVDVGSHHKFVALLSKVMPVTMVDIRPLSLPLDTLTFREGSILALPYADGELESVSSLCVVEHIGLGRYGDPLDPYGTEKAIAELKRVIAPGGSLYLSIPVGETTIAAFNAGRIMGLEQLMVQFEPFQVIEKRFIIGSRFQEIYAPMPNFGATGLFHLVR